MISAGARGMLGPMRAQAGFLFTRPRLETGVVTAVAAVAR
jgi:hypothetical protein